MGPTRPGTSPAGNSTRSFRALLSPACRQALESFTGSAIDSLSNEGGRLWIRARLSIPGIAQKAEPRGAPLLFLVLVLAAAPARANTITVNSVADVAANDGQCTLREAIIAANTNAGFGGLSGECAAGDNFGMDVIAFNISGGGVHTIKPLTALPAITQSVLIDGYTQPGSSMNTNPFPGALNTVLQIELDNTNSQLRFDGPIRTVRGLAINRGADNIVINADDIVVIGNFIGTNPAGTAAVPGSGYGVHILESGIGRTSATAAASPPTSAT